MAIKFEKVSYETFSKCLETYSFGGYDYEAIKLPKRSTKNSAGYDFYCPVNLNCEPGKTYFITLGVKARMDSDKVLMIFPRSSLGFKYGFRLSNTAGVIDSDYYNNESNEGMIMMKFTVDTPMALKAGDKICQGIFMKYYITDDDISDTERRGGIGSTGN